MKNKRIREAVNEAGLRLWNLADMLKINPTTLSVMLRHELPEEEQDRILKLIEENREGTR
jgi:hypothetical protein